MLTYTTSDSGTTPKPLVIVLHGCGQSAKDVADLTGWNKLADMYGFLMLYPQQQLRNNSGVCFNWFKEKNIEKGFGECESIYEMILYMKSHYQVDEKNIYITGLSAGGAMTTVMLATHPETFKAGAVFAGGAYKSSKNGVMSIASMMGINGQKRSILINHVKAENPSFHEKYPFLIVYHGMSDHVVHPYNSELLITQWTGVHDASPYPTTTDSKYQNFTDITRCEYQNRNGEVVVIAYKIKNMGHQIPVNPGSKPNEGGNSRIFGWDRNFHSTYQTAVEFGLIK